jgi:hypothetical protein
MKVYHKLNKGVTLIHDGRLFITTINSLSLGPASINVIAHYIDDLGNINCVIRKSIYGMMIVEELKKLKGEQNG